ncbi:metallophosphoesterase family protein [Frondihabitans australicus]|uniref:Calcineurin-like phosphoesterase family protein n=1 Tax=Frondihabitans australicus TaxID=386892 RepID=A0A495IG74_9MICO|nr:metallophosphoesterase [Frondihabitans australicus]RKR74749.1 calcineurin-like phosphoesterase family protein [Frondihabitans australicus]
MKPDRHVLVDDRIGLLGDPHADFQWTKLAIRNLDRAGIRQIHVLGDFGFLSNGNPYERERLRQLNNALLARNQYVFITGGNHEGYPTLHRMRQPDAHGYRRLERRIIWLPRGWRGRTESGSVLGSLGGANSINGGSRKSIGGHIGEWHAEEQITEEDLSALGTERVDVLLGHDAPITAALDRHIAKNRHFWTEKGFAYARAGQAMFHRGVEQVRPKLVVSGHYHRHLDTTGLLQPAGQEPFGIRSVILDRNRTARSVGILQPDSLTLDVPEKLSPGLRRERDAATRWKRRRRLAS